MNLPMDALEFLDVLNGRFDRNIWKKLPMIHVYGFALVDNARDMLITRIKHIWGDFDDTLFKIIQIRDISSKKLMFCVEFVIPEEIAYKDIRIQPEIHEEKLEKKIKINDDN